MLIKNTIFLVVDDCEAMCNFTMSTLRALGVVRFYTAKNGAEALRILRNENVDFVLSDWQMPIMSGLDLLRAIRADSALAHLPFIMITAEADQGRIRVAIEAGVSDMLIKPYTADRLAQRIEKAIADRPRLAQTLRDLLPASRQANQVLPGGPGQDATGSKQIAPMSDEQSRLTILAVDDTPDNLTLLSGLFKDEYRVRIANTGEKALGICQSNNPPDLVLLDIMMPGLDGFEVAKRMREHPTSETIPVIFVTALTSEDACLKGMEIGAVDFVTKPINPLVLKLRVRNFMRYVALRKQLQTDFDGLLEASRLREDVEQIMRHDLKGPLAGIIGMVQLLANDVSLNCDQVSYLRRVEKMALLVLNMANMSSELFKIETGRFKLNAKPVKIGKILSRIIEISNATFIDKHIVVTFDPAMPVFTELPEALGDAMLCYSLFQNLILNACEAAPEDSQVTVSIRDKTPLHIVIMNKGVVPAAIRARFFDKFVTHGKPDGTGLGTYSAKLLTEAQNGEISMDVSEQENLTTIIVKLPRYAS